MKILAIAMILAAAPGTAAAAGWYLVLSSFQGDIVLAARPYPTREACIAAGRAASLPEGGAVANYECFPAP